MRRTGTKRTAKEFKGLRFLLRRNWEILAGAQRGVIREIGTTDRCRFRAWQLKEELRDVFAPPLRKARRALDAWLACASRSRLPSFVNFGRTIRAYRPADEATNEWRLADWIGDSNNASIGRIRTNARWFHNPKRSSR